MSSNNPSTCADVDKSSDDVFFHIGHSTIVQQEENLDYVDGGEEADGGVEAGIEGGFDDDEILNGNGPNEDVKEVGEREESGEKLPYIRATDVNLGNYSFPSLRFTPDECSNDGKEDG